MDETDRAIIARLQYDGRTPFTDIAAELGIAEGTVRRRVKRLSESGVLQIVGIVEPQFLGWNAAGMIGVTVQAGQVDAVAHQIAQFPEVSYLFMVSGEFDLFIEIYCKDMDHFVSFLNQKLQQVPGVQRTQSFMILKMYKLSYRWGEAEPPRTGHGSHSGLESPQSDQWSDHWPDVMR
ncbi:MAG: Lrp/AsnC family transcriptional regulator [Anaerolineae bacterium]|nr:Lrp/AsnC family transcriptional regulator [Anaerolineae bacterium]